MQYVFLCGNWDFVNVAVIITAVPRNRGICDIFKVIFPAGMGQLFFTVMGMGQFKKRGNVKSPITAVITAVITARDYYREAPYYFEFGVLHFRLPLYTRNGQIGEHVLLLWFLALVLAGCCCQLVCFECCASFPFAYTRNGQIVEHVRRTERNKKDLAPPSRARGSTWGLFLQVC